LEKETKIKKKGKNNRIKVWIPHDLVLNDEKGNEKQPLSAMKHPHHGVKGRGLLLYIKITSLYKIETCVSLKSAVILSSCSICTKV